MDPDGFFIVVVFDIEVALPYTAVQIPDIPALPGDIIYPPMVFPNSLKTLRVPKAYNDDGNEPQASTKETEKPNKRSEFRPAKRKHFKTRKEAYEEAKRAGGGREPELHYHSDKPPHYHPNVPKDSGKIRLPHKAYKHDHYYFPKCILLPIDPLRFKHNLEENYY